MGLMFDLIWLVVGVVSCPVWGWRMLRGGKWKTDWAGRFGKTKKVVKGAGEKVILIHAVSVGEMNAVRQLVTELAGNAGKTKVVISTTTNTGYARAVALFGGRHEVVRYPLDFSFAVRRFLDAIRPDVVGLVENEVWPNFTRECAKRGIRLCLINGRLSERSFKRYRWLGCVVKGMYGRLTAAGVQTQAYAERVIALGAKTERVKVLDTMKWDTAQVVKKGEDAKEMVAGAKTLAEAMGLDLNRPVVVAGSTGPGEEELLIKVCPQEVQLVLVPRKPERFEEVAGLDKQMIRRTQHPDGTKRKVDGKRLFLVDTMGELRKAYALADVCIVGRSFLGLYGSDMMEPAGLGKPVIVGMHHGDFQDTVDALRAGDGLVVTDRPGEAVRELLTDKKKAQALGDRAREVILSRQGATKRYAKLLMEAMEAGAC